MKRLVIGILAHVDAGKTTLTEAMLFEGGALRRLGRVDHKDAFLDNNALERERGITIFTKQAVLRLPETELQIIDTPGHVDFSAEMERALSVLDYAVLIVSGSDGVQGHTRTLWRLLKRYSIPTFIFVNKMDIAERDRASLMAELSRLDGACADFSSAASAEEAAAATDEAMLEKYVATGHVEAREISRLIACRRIFPCCFGSALRVEGVRELIMALDRYTIEKRYGTQFAARVYKIARDAQGQRLTFMKLTGGELRVKAQLMENGEKADQIRIYSGEKFAPAEVVTAGQVCAVTGLASTHAGDALGCEDDAQSPLLQPVLHYRVALPDGADEKSALIKLKALEEENPELMVEWNAQSSQIEIRLMGEVQLEILRDVIKTRFGLCVEFTEGSIVYRETIASPVVGMGHFEPLRHYAEVCLLLEPGERGSGLVFETSCPEEALAKNFQRIVMTHLEEKQHLGVLAGAPVTDMRITLINGRSHLKHTEGGDFRQATYRAVRQGLMCAKSVLLEPWYEFRMEVPGDCVGRALNDVQRMGARVRPVETDGAISVISGDAPVYSMRNYSSELVAYTRGHGRLSCVPKGYEPCPEQEKRVSELGYDPEADLDNPSGSVFCTHTGGGIIPWYMVESFMHTEVDALSTAGDGSEHFAPSGEAAPAPQKRLGSLEEDKELMAIFERTYGAVKRRDFRPQNAVRANDAGKKPQPAAKAPAPVPAKPKKSDEKEYLLVDGYNIIFAWDELKTIARENLDAARQRLLDALCNYQGVTGEIVIAVFDAYRVPGNPGSVSRYHNIFAVYTKEAETADAYIEKTTREIARDNRVRVATSDGAEQMIVLGYGALRLPARAFHDEMLKANRRIADILSANNRSAKAGVIREAIERAIAAQADELHTHTAPLHKK